MKSARGILAAAGLLAALAITAADGKSTTDTVQPATASATSLRPVSDFDAIRSRKKRSLALFTEVGKVLQHPRCLNCHPRNDIPTQTEAMRPHIPKVVRGEAGIGVPGQYCIACHHSNNYDPANVPGHARWLLAPAEMAWAGKPLGDICRQLKDKKRNGGKTMEEMVHHMTKDDLIAWGWKPGGDREPAPGTQKELGALFAAWAASGAYCPS